MNFQEMIARRTEMGKNFCIPLSSALSGLTARQALRQSRKIVEEAAGFACAFKLDMVFYEVLGAAGPKVLKKTISLIRAAKRNLGVPIILDTGKGRVNDDYLEMLVSLGVDALVFYPFPGSEQRMFLPLLRRKDLALFLYCPNPFLTGWIREWCGTATIMPAVGTAVPEELCEVRKARGEESLILVLKEAFSERPSVGASLWEIFRAVGLRNVN